MNVCMYLVTHTDVYFCWQGGELKLRLNPNAFNLTSELPALIWVVTRLTAILESLTPAFTFSLVLPSLPHLVAPPPSSRLPGVTWPQVSAAERHQAVALCRQQLLPPLPVSDGFACSSMWLLRVCVTCRHVLDTPLRPGDTPPFQLRHAPHVISLVDTPPSCSSFVKRLKFTLFSTVTRFKSFL